MSIFRSFRSLVIRRSAVLAFLATAGMGVTACSDSTGPNESGVAFVRVVNSLYQDNTTAIVPVGIDYLFDSTTAAPSILNLPAADVSTGDSANRYREIERGVRSFLARRVNDTSANASIYTTANDFAYLPKQALIANQYYTIVVSGTIPATGAVPNGRIPISVLADDPFPGPRIESTGVLQARFRVINAAPYASASGNGATVNVYLTPGTTPPATITDYAALGRFVAHRSSSAYLNVNPGAYVLTIASTTGVIFAQQAVTFTQGQVRSFVFQSTSQSATPSAANHKLTDILDKVYTP